ncbi:unnamed protein product [Pieris brassicae]|uniref:Uncharacterized protein n=1 Tax=Pieris brassicae TaxID=7116 RepID=A0A9P0XJ50_PIEBR|nr:unnamed protein product [Pieris brassicae]
MVKKQNGSVIRFLFLEGKSHSEIKERLEYTVTLLLRWRPSKIGLTIFNKTSVFDEPHLPSKTATTEHNVTKNRQTTD